MTDLRDTFADGEYELVVEALCELRQRKEEALQVAATLPSNGDTRRFTAGDFGIPQIDDILKRLDAEPIPSAYVAGTSMSSGTMQALAKQMADLLNVARVNMRDIDNGWPTKELASPPREFEERAVALLATYEAAMSMPSTAAAVPSFLQQPGCVAEPPERRDVAFVARPDSDEYSVSAPDGSLITVGNKGSLAERVLYQVAAVFTAASASAAVRPLVSPVNSDPEDADLAQVVRNVVRELDDLGFKDPDEPVNGGDCVEVVAQLLPKLRNAVAECDQCVRNDDGVDDEPEGMKP